MLVAEPASAQAYRRLRHDIADRDAAARVALLSGDGAATSAAHRRR